MKIQNMKCPNCQAALDMEVNDGKNFAFCPYCGSKFYIDDGKTEHTINKNININKNTNNTNRTIDEAEVIKAKSEANANKFAMIFLIAFLVISGISSAIWFIGDAIKEKSAKVTGKVSIGYYDDFVGEDYKGVEKKLRGLGFTDIEIVDLGDSGLAFWKNNTVESISVDGDSSFESNDYFDTDAKIIINHH